MPPLFPGIRIEAAELRLVRLPLLTPFVISTGTMTEKVFPLLILKAEGIEGYAEGVMDILPDYLEETQAGALPFLRDALLPQIVGKRFASPAELGAILDPWRGHKMSKAMVEMAVWDLWAKALGLPLSAALGGVRDAVEVGVSLGIADIPKTLDRVREAVEGGYRRIKLKIKRGHDLDLLAAVRAEFPKTKLTVDANTDYRLNDLPLLKAMDAFALDYIEQPLAFDVPVWCGGMLEAGIGRAQNIHLATLPNFSKPGDTSSSSRYFAHDIVNEPLEAANGLMAVPRHGAGLGVTLNHDFLNRVTSQTEVFRP